MYEVAHILSGSRDASRPGAAVIVFACFTYQWIVRTTQNNTPVDLSQLHCALLVD